MVTGHLISDLIIFIRVTLIDPSKFVVFAVPQTVGALERRVSCRLELFVYINSQVLFVELRLVILVLVVLHRVVIRAWLRFVPAAYEEIVEDFEKLLNLILALEKRLFPGYLCSRLPKLRALIYQGLVQVIICASLGALLPERPLAIAPDYLLLSLLEDGMALDNVEDLLPAISASCLLNHLGQVRKLLDWICNLLSESEYDCPYKQKKDDTRCED